MEKLTGVICLISISLFVLKIMIHMLMSVYTDINSANKRNVKNKKLNQYNYKDKSKSKQIV